MAQTSSISRRLILRAVVTATGTADKNRPNSSRMDAVKTLSQNRIASRRAPPLIQNKRPQRIARSHRQVLMAIQQKRLRSIRHIADACIPQRLAGLRIMRY